MARELDPTWGDQANREIHANVNDEFVDFEGWDRAGFVERYGVGPEKVGLPPCLRTHPLSNQQCAVYYAPKAGPFLTLRLLTRDASQWVQDK